MKRVSLYKKNLFTYFYLESKCFSSNANTFDVLRRVVDRASAADQRLGRRVDRDQDRTAGRDQRFAGNASTHLVSIVCFSL